MTTATQLISRSLRLLSVLDPNTPASSVDIETGITALNSMLSRWEANGLAVGWASVTLGTDTVPLPAEAEEAVVYQLALRLRPEYGAALDPDVIGRAREALAELRRDRLVFAPLKGVSDLPSGGHWNITTDEPV
jgi:hypothetical protein